MNPGHVNFIDALKAIQLDKRFKSATGQRVAITHDYARAQISSILNEWHQRRSEFDGTGEPVELHINKPLWIAMSKILGTRFVDVKGDQIAIVGMCATPVDSLFGLKVVTDSFVGWTLCNELSDDLVLLKGKVVKKSERSKQ